MGEEITLEGIMVAKELRDCCIFYGDFGSISMRDGEIIWVTKSGAEKYEFKGFILVNPEGNCVDDEFYDGNFKGSGEHLVHAAVLNAHGKYNSVIHTHSPLHAAFGNVFPGYFFDQHALEMRKVLGIRDPKESFTLPTVPNSFDKAQLSESVCKSLGDNIAVLVQNHGLYVAGPDLKKARDYVKAIDHMMHQVFYEALMKR